MILSSTPTAYVIDHSVPLQTDNSTFTLNPILFKIQAEFKKLKTIKKNAPPSPQISKSAVFVKTIFDTEIVQILSFSSKARDPNGNKEAIEFSRKFFKDCPQEFQPFSGANSNEFAVFYEINEKVYLFPTGSKFHCVKDLMGYDFGSGETYDLIVIDPPWFNRFVKRRKRSAQGYTQLEAISLKSLNLPKILSKNSLIAIWTTNSPKIQSTLMEELLPYWGLHLVSKWYWLKTTTNGNPITPFADQGSKQPFEILILASNADFKSEQKIIVSTPSAISSHKPPLTHVLETHFQTKFNKKCELFARYLLPEYTSYGNQVIKLMDKELYIESVNC